MDSRPIRTEAEYDAVLAEVEALWGAPIDTPEGHRVDVLIASITVYEALHHSIDPPERS